MLTHATAPWLKSKNSIHPFTIFHQLMEPIHAELVRLATELEAVRGQVQTECNALRDLFARTTAAISGSQHDRRLNHREAERHLPQQFGPVVSTMETLHFEWKVMQRSCQAMDSALLREVAKLEKFEADSTDVLVRTLWDVHQLSAAMAAALTTCTRGEATLVRRILSVNPGDGLQAWHAVTQWL